MAISRVLSTTIITSVLNMPKPEIKMIVEMVSAEEIRSTLNTCSQVFSRSCQAMVECPKAS